MRIVIAIATTVLLGACGQPADAPTKSDQAAGPTTAPTAATPATPAIDSRWEAHNACALLDRDTVEAALGIAVKSKRLAALPGQTYEAERKSSCLYTLKDGQQVEFFARLSATAENTPELFKASREGATDMAGPIEDVTGLGRSAFWIPKLRQVVVYEGEDRLFKLTLPEHLDGKDPKMLALSLAGKVK